LSQRVDLAEFLSAFVAEADEQLRIATARLLSVEQAERKGEHDPRSVRDAFRALHTIKGLSAMVGVEAIVGVAHAMEGALRLADRAGGALDAAAVEPLVQGVKAIEQRVRALERGEPVEPIADSLMVALDALDHKPTADASPPERLVLEPSIESKLVPFERELLLHPTGGRRALRLEFAPSPERAARNVTINSVRDRVGAIAEIVRVFPVSAPASERAPAGFLFILLVLTTAGDMELAEACGVDASCVQPLTEPRRPPAPTAKAVLAATATVDLDEPEDEQPRRSLMRVNVARVDDAMDRLGALLVTRARLAGVIGKLTASGADTRELAQVAQENARQLRDLRASILQVRMVPVGEVLERLPLIVRSLRRTSGKHVALVLDGGGAELDKAVADLVFPALVHLVRNAVDHGIESPAERQRAGKPVDAMLRIACVSRSSTGVVLSVQDDGRGIDAEAVARKAGRPVPVSEAELLDLICQPGLTTRDEATTTSGRGLGMDIVKRIVVDQLGGELVLHMEPGKGTTFSLQIPLTVAILDAFVVECMAQRFAVPVAAVEEIVEIDPSTIITPPRSSSDGAGDRAVVRTVGITTRRREALALYTFVNAAPANPSTSLKALVVRRRGEAIGFIVERVIGQQEVVVRPLVDPLVRVPGIVGATELGDGRATLVLDVASLTAPARGQGARLGAEVAPRRLPEAPGLARSIR
jgi:two-component system chemotaxis sensor kinase CheA